MKTRIISAIAAVIIVVPLLLLGGIPYKIGVWCIAVLGMKEFLSVLSTKKELPFSVKLISYILLTLFLFTNYKTGSILFTVDLRLLAGVFMLYLLPALYHDSKRYDIHDAFYLTGGTIFLGIAFALLLLIREISLPILFYLILITTMTDTYAYVTGVLIGKHKLLESVSPNKTWEGTVGGTFFGVFIASTFYLTVIDSEASVLLIILLSLFLSCIGQFGDLVFSIIKRYYGKKDFSNIMPGHGGILDRFDSLIFVVLGFMFFISII